MLKTLVTALLVLVCAGTAANAAVTAVWEYEVEIRPDSPNQQGYHHHGEQGYNLVYFVSDDELMMSRLECIGSGTASCCLCDMSMSTDEARLFANGAVDALFELAEANVTSGNGSGSSVDNIVSGGFTYNRTLVWSSNSTTGDRDYSVTIVENTL